MRPSFLLALSIAVSAGCERSTPTVAGSDRTVEVQDSGGYESPGSKGQSVLTGTRSPEIHVSESRPAGSSNELSELDPVFRPDDDRIQHDDERLRKVGINRISSKRLVLYTDLPLETVQRLPELVDAIFPEWEEYFGPLPPARDGSEFQLTGYVMADDDLFSKLGLVPANLPYFEHGLHRGRQFWIRDQAYEYYREHLLLHEATHCYMTTLPASIAPVWYMEGMAEHFAAHRRLDDGSFQFRVMPKSPAETAGFDRISIIRNEIEAGRYCSLEDVFAIRAAAFTEKTPYAWSWAACYFFDNHPRCAERFRQLADPAIRSTFGAAFRKAFDEDLERVMADWRLFAQCLCYGYQLPEAMTLYQDSARPLDSRMSQLAISASKGWQSTGLLVEAGQSYVIEASGAVTLAKEPLPWRSEADGISFDYADGRPLGQLLAAILPLDSSEEDSREVGLDAPIAIGRKAVLDAPATGILFFRVNDGWDRLSDNDGNFTVTARLAID